MASRIRLDVLLVERGLAPSRERAQALILEGAVTLAGQPQVKAGQSVPADALVEISGPEMPFVSRGGLKLARALEAFPIAVSGKVCLDVGASTGGFTDCLLQAGAARVYAVDVGYGQLDWRLRQDARVITMERTNIRRLEELPEQPELAVIDVSFISLAKVLPAVTRLLAGSAHIVALVKPQFEVGPKRAPKGVVRDPAAHREVLMAAAAGARQLRWQASGLAASPITGPAGNREFLLWLTHDNGDVVDEAMVVGCVAS